MKLTEATQADLAAMNSRLKQKKEERLAQEEMDEVVKMVQKRPFVIAPQKDLEKDAKDTFFFNGINLFVLASVGATAWNITGNYFFLIFFFVLAVMSGTEFKKAFT